MIVLWVFGVVGWVTAFVLLAWYKQAQRKATYYLGRWYEEINASRGRDVEIIALKQLIDTLKEGNSDVEGLLRTNNESLKLENERLRQGIINLIQDAVADVEEPMEERL